MLKGIDFDHKSKEFRSITTVDVRDFFRQTLLGTAMVDTFFVMSAVLITRNTLSDIRK